MSDVRTAIEALDALALALANHHHVWTAQERSLYERSVRSCERLLRLASKL